jgi:SulP family sulfate permease
VVSGFMSGIGVIIILIQTLPFVGMATVPSGASGVLHEWANTAILFNSAALIIACITLAIMTFWPARLQKLLPPPLAALVARTLLGLYVFNGAPVIGDVPTGLPDLRRPFLTIINLPSIVQPAFVLVLLGTIDSLLTPLVANSITRTRHKSDRELIGQGIANMVAT